MDLHGTQEARAQEESGGGRVNERRDSHTPPLPFEFPLSPTGQPLKIVRRDPTPSREAIVIPAALNVSPRDERVARKARRVPPVTKKTLSELDLPSIMTNINLRMDANYDRDLHFKPDLGGEKGKRKLREGGEYWEAIATEIAAYQYYAKFPSELEVSLKENPRRAFEPRIPAMFEALLDIIKTLVPERDHQVAEDTLEVSFLMQQIRKGCLDMAEVAGKVAELLKTHCAPLRDEMADQVVDWVLQGQEAQDPRLVATGLQTLFGLLETMKLDVANHQIRTFIDLLIEDTVPFLQEYFREKYGRWDTGLSGAREQFTELRAELDRIVKMIPGETEELAVFFLMIAQKLVQCDAPAEFPSTFALDEDRLWQLRGSIQNLICLEIVWQTMVLQFGHPDRTFEEFEREIGPQVRVDNGHNGLIGVLNGVGAGTRGNANWPQNLQPVADAITIFAGKDIATESAGVQFALQIALTTDDPSHEAQALRVQMMRDIVAASLEYSHSCCSNTPIEMARHESYVMQQEHPKVPHNLRRVPHKTVREELTRIAMRFAHMGVLHWWVFSRWYRGWGVFRVERAPTPPATSAP